MRSRVLAGALGLSTVFFALGALTSVQAVGWTFDEALEAFVVSNICIGVGFGLCGALIAWHRPESPLGWMYAGGGACQAVSALAAPLAVLLVDRGGVEGVVRLVATLFQWGWSVNIALIPISLLLLPEGRIPSRRWRLVTVALAFSAPLFVAEIGLGPEHAPGVPPAFLTLDEGTYESLRWLWTLSEGRWALSVVIGVVYLVVRYRHGTEVVRRQLLWPVAAAAVIVVAVVPWALVAGTPLAVLFTIPLLPAAVTAAVLRHQLLDIRLVVARGITYALLSALVLAAYAALVVVLSGVASALVVALLALPLRSRLQGAVDQLLYGERGSPLKVASRVGRSFGDGLPETLEEIRTALRLPYVGVVVGGTPLASGGVLDGPSADLPLQEGTLVVGLRRGETRLAPADERILVLLSGPLSTAVHATTLLEELQVSRERLVVAREEERRRLRRELHDGLGPLLTGVALSADTAANLAQHAGGAPDDALQETLSAVRSRHEVRHPGGAPDRRQPRPGRPGRARARGGAAHPRGSGQPAVRRGCAARRGGGGPASTAAHRGRAGRLPDRHRGPHQRHPTLAGGFGGGAAQRRRGRTALRGARRRGRAGRLAAGRGAQPACVSGWPSWADGARWAPARTEGRCAYASR